MENWQERVISESKDLHVKLVYLEEFMESDQFRKLPDDDRDLLRIQFHSMSAYWNVLGLRINRFSHATH